MNKDNENLEVVSVDSLIESLQEMSVAELVTLVNLCTDAIEDKTAKL